MGSIIKPMFLNKNQQMFFPPLRVEIPPALAITRLKTRLILHKYSFHGEKQACTHRQNGHVFHMDLTQATKTGGRF